MNFCASLTALADLSQTALTDTLWVDLNKQMSDALKQESDVDFIRPAMLAIDTSLRDGYQLPQGQQPGHSPSEHFAVSVKL